jgi:hypothetical protein
MSKTQIGRARWALVIGIILWAMWTVITNPVEAADATPITPLYQQTVNDIGELQNGDTITIIGMSNVKQMADHYAAPEGMAVNNAACGGCVSGDWGNAQCKDFAANGRTLWPNVPVGTQILLANIANRGRGTLTDYKAQLKSDVEGILSCANKKLPNLREVWFLSMHGEPFAVGTKQDHDFAFVSGEIADELRKDDLGYPFKVLLGPYGFANSTPRGDNLAWLREDIKTSDNVHQTPSGQIKWAGVVSEFSDAASDGTGGGGGGGGDPVEVCEPIAPQTKCDLNRNPGYCTCAWPVTQIAWPPDDGGGDPDPEPEDCPTPGWAERKGLTCGWDEAADRCRCTQ